MIRVLESEHVLLLALILLNHRLILGRSTLAVVLVLFINAMPFFES